MYYSYNGDQATIVYNYNGNVIDNSGLIDYSDITVKSYATKSISMSSLSPKQEYMGGYIEIQPDSYNGSGRPAYDSTTETWGFPYSLSEQSKEEIHNEILSGNGYGMMFVRFPLGFAYRGYRNIDAITGLAKNFGERFEGQNESLRTWLESISDSGGGIAPEYWSPPPYWMTGGNTGYLSASAGSTTKLSEIYGTTSYDERIDAFTDAIVDDLEYLHQNVARVCMFGLQNEPHSMNASYGSCGYDEQTYYDVMNSLVPKIRNSQILSVWKNQQNEVLLHTDSQEKLFNNWDLCKRLVDENKDWFWGYTHHVGANGGDGIYSSARYKQYVTDIIGDVNNVFNNEFEYFNGVSEDEEEGAFINSVQRMMREMIYSGACCPHPVIHICKQIGATSQSSNTSGYCMYKVDLSDGSIEPNRWAHSAWLPFNSIPIGSVVYCDGDNNAYNGAWMIFEHDRKKIVMLCNNASEFNSIKISFGSTKSFAGKEYGIDGLNGSVFVRSGETIEFKCKPKTVQVWFER